MSNIKLNCCECGKELGLGSRVSTDGVLWRCEECAIKQREEYDNKDKTIADLEAKLAEKDKELIGRKKLCDLRYEQLKQAHQDKIKFAIEQLNKLLDQTALRGVSDWTAWVHCIKLQISELRERK